MKKPNATSGASGRLNTRHSVSAVKPEHENCCIRQDAHKTGGELEVKPALNLGQACSSPVMGVLSGASSLSSSALLASGALSLFLLSASAPSGATPAASSSYLSHASDMPQLPIQFSIPVLRRALRERNSNLRYTAGYS